MKKQIFFILFAVAVIAFSSCIKKKYCANCIEANTGVTGNFCGPESAVDDYISELKSQGAAAGQSWSCEKKQD